MIKTWQQRCDEHPDHDGIVSEGMIQARMQEEIDELRAAIEQPRQWQGLTDDERVRFRQLGFVGVEIVEATLKERNS